jgi:hypothetical protein
MRLFKLSAREELTLEEFVEPNISMYAILSHTWRADGDEIIFKGSGLIRASTAMQRFSSVRNKLGRTAYNISG